MDKKNKLFEIADRQQGFFTSKQAEECGFSRSNFHLKIKSGEWINIIRGIYKLAYYQSYDRPELALWSLWSRGKNGIPKGVWSHETAMDIHNISDIMHSKLHMIVPKGFRRRGEIPKNIQIHFSDISKQDIEERQGYSVTTPIRTLTDIIKEGTISNEQIATAINNAIEKGIITIREAEKICDFSQKIGKIDLSKIIYKTMNDLWNRAKILLTNLGYKAEPYTIGLSFGDKGGAPFGTGILIEYHSKFFILTACHVARQIKKQKSIRLILRFDNFKREYPSHYADEFIIKEWDENFDEKFLNNKESILSEHPKDLALIIPGIQIINSLKQFKSFYKITNIKNFSKEGKLFSLGGIDLQFSQDSNTYNFNVGPFALGNCEKKEFKETDYIICYASNNTFGIRNLKEKYVPTFKGLSGGGLWQYVDDNVFLTGIAFAEDTEGYDKKTGLRSIFFHGTKSIINALQKIYKDLGNK